MEATDNELTASVDRVGELLSFWQVRDAGQRLDQVTDQVIKTTISTGDKLGGLLETHLKEVEHKVSQTLAPVSEQAKSGNWTGWY